MANIIFTPDDIQKWVSYGPTDLTRFWGYNPNATKVYIMFFDIEPGDGGAAILDATSPAVASFECAANAAFSFTNPFNLKTVTVCMSSTEDVLTMVGAGTGLNMTLQTYSDSLVQGNETIVENLAGGNSQAVWSDNQEHQLLKLYVNTGNSGTPAFAFLSGDGATAPTERIIHFEGSVDYVERSFGTSGLSIVQQSKSYANKPNLTVLFSSDGVAVNPLAITAVKAIYR